MGSHKELVRMKILSLLCLLFGLAHCSRQNENRPHENENCWKQCSTEGYIALVKCPLTEAEPCTCAEENCETIIGPKFGNQSWVACHDLAMAHQDDALKNEFFRWEHKTHETHCYFLNECKNIVPADCAPYDNAPCVAGDSTVGCAPDPENICDPAVWNDDGLHWNCFDASHQPVSAYTNGNADNKLGVGTTCTTGNSEECSTWEWKTGDDDDADHKDKKKVANVECDADSGGWKSRVDILELVTKDDAEVSIMPGKAGDAMCICDTFVISKATFEIPGINIACEQVLDQDPNSGDGGIEFGNGCAVLCDSHFMMYIECFKGKWKNTAEYPFMEVTEDDINC